MCEVRFMIRENHFEFCEYFEDSKVKKQSREDRLYAIGHHLIQCKDCDCEEILDGWVKSEEFRKYLPPDVIKCVK